MKAPEQVQLLDDICSNFVNEFSTDSPLAVRHPLLPRFAGVDGIELSLGMRNMSISYRTPEEQRRDFTAIPADMLELYGIFSASISTYTKEGNMAGYNFDRNSGLVVVNNFEFPSGEVRRLRSGDFDLLDESIATRGITSFVMNRALTERGTERLITDIQKVILEA